MEFRYLNELFSSWKLMWKKQNVFWGAFVFTLSFMLLMFILIISTINLDSITIQNFEATTTFEIYQTIYSDSPTTLILSIVLFTVFGLAFTAGIYGSLTKIAKNEETSFSTFFSQATHNFSLFIPIMILVFLINFIIELLISYNPLIRAILMPISLLIGFILFFSYPAISDGKGSIGGIIYSVNNAFTYHRLKVYLVALLGAFIIVGGVLLSSLVAGLLMLILVGFLLIPLIFLGAYMFMMGIILYTIKAYMFETSESSLQPFEASKQSSDLPTGDGGSAK